MRNLVLAAILLFAVQANAKTADEILKSGTPEQIGLAIAQEAERRDEGWENSIVDVRMVLKNASGANSERKMRNKLFEVTDKSIGDKTMIVFDKPRDVKGTAFLTHSKILEADDQWLYLPALRRVKRISSRNKSGPFMGSEFAYEDISSREVGKYDYKYLRNEKCGEFECFVVENYPKYEYSGYTRQIAWVDTKEFRPIKVDFYDRKDALYKTLEYSGYEQYLGKYWRAEKFAMVNHQNDKATDLFFKNYQFKVGLNENDFTKSQLKRAR